MDNLSSYCGLVDAKIRASDKDLPVPHSTAYVNFRKQFNRKVQWKYSKKKSLQFNIIARKYQISMVSKSRQKTPK